MDWRALRFDRAAAAYDRVTPVQKDMARRLAGLLPADFDPRTVLELGCGTGHLTRALLPHLPRSSFLVTDLAPSMLQACAATLPTLDRSRVRLGQLDGRAPELDEADVDLVASSAMVQWFADLDTHFAKVRDCLAPGGIYLVSGFCRGNFPELDAVLSRPPFAYGEPPGHFLTDAREAARRQGFSVELSEQDRIELAYPSALEFLRAIGQAGASRTPRDGKPLTRELLRELLARYEEVAGLPEGGVRATWRPWYLVLRRG